MGIKQYILKKVFKVDVPELTLKIISLNSQVKIAQDKTQELQGEVDRLRSHPGEFTYVMDDRVFDKLAASLPGAGVTGSTTDIQAGFQLGIQHTLNVLRGHVA